MSSANENATEMYSQFSLSLCPAHSVSVYGVRDDGSLWVTYASGMDVTLSTEPTVSSGLLPGALSGLVHPTVGRCNITLPGEPAHSLIEWRQRREQAKGNHTAYERRLRVTHCTTYDCVCRVG